VVTASGLAQSMGYSPAFLSYLEVEVKSSPMDTKCFVVFLIWFGLVVCSKYSIAMFTIMRAATADCLRWKCWWVWLCDN